MEIPRWLKVCGVWRYVSWCDRFRPHNERVNAAGSSAPRDFIEAREEAASTPTDLNGHAMFMYLIFRTLKVRNAANL